MIDSRPMLPKGVLVDRYRIDEYIASGGFGNTYKATHTGFNEVVAIKEFFIRGINQRDENSTTVSVSNHDNCEIFDSQLKKFRKEAQRLRQMDNPHIVGVRDLFDANGTAYYVMDFVEGQSLAAYLKKSGQPLSEKMTRKILDQVLDALQFVHNKGIYHLDLKPANLMVDDKWMVRLIDFGASKQQSMGGEGATATTGVCYTTGFAPREQMEQNLDKFGPWTDLYALGGTLYNLLTLRKPPMPSVIDDDETSDKRESLPMTGDISLPMQKLIRWLMEYKPSKRPQNVAQVNKFIAKHFKDEEEEVTISAALPIEEDDATVSVQVIEKQKLEPELEVKTKPMPKIKPEPEQEAKTKPMPKMIPETDETLPYEPKPVIASVVNPVSEPKSQPTLVKPKKKQKAEKVSEATIKEQPKPEPKPKLKPEPKQAPKPNAEPESGSKSSGKTIIWVGALAAALVVCAWLFFGRGSSTPDDVVEAVEAAEAVEAVEAVEDLDSVVEALATQDVVETTVATEKPASSDSPKKSTTTSPSKPSGTSKPSTSTSSSKPSTSPSKPSGTSKPSIPSTPPPPKKKPNQSDYESNKLDQYLN